MVPVVFVADDQVAAEEDAVLVGGDEIFDGGPPPGGLFGDGADDPLGGGGVDDVVGVFVEALGEEVDAFQRAAEVGAQVEAVGVFVEHAFELGELGVGGAIGSVGVFAVAEVPGAGVADVGHEVVAEGVGVLGEFLDFGVVEGDAPAAHGAGGGVELDEAGVEGWLGEGFEAAHPVFEEVVGGGEVLPGGDGDEVELAGEFFLEGWGVFEGAHGVELGDAVGAGDIDEELGEGGFAGVVVGVDDAGGEGEFARGDVVVVEAEAVVRDDGGGHGGRLRGKGVWKFVPGVRASVELSAGREGGVRGRARMRGEGSLVRSLVHIRTRRYVGKVCGSRDWRDTLTCPHSLSTNFLDGGSGGIEISIGLGASP